METMGRSGGTIENGVRECEGEREKDWNERLE